MNFIQPNYESSKEAANAFMNRQNEFDSYIQEQLNERSIYDQTGSRIERGYVTLNNNDDMGERFDFIKENGGHTNYAQEATKNIHCDSELARVYFSKENIDLLQDMIRYQVYEQSNQQHVVARQSDTELEIIMRHFYLTYGKNQPENITGQIAELNTYVVNECVPMIISSVEQYLAYRLRITQQPVPLARSVNMSSKGSKQLEPNHWL